MMNQKEYILTIVKLNLKLQCKGQICQNVITVIHTCTHIRATITVPKMAAAGGAVNNTNKKVIFKNWAPFSNCISEVNNTQIDDAKDIDITMPMYNLIEYSGTYSKISGSLWKYYSDEPALDSNSNIIYFPANNNNNISFNFKEKITGQTGNDGRKYIETMVPLRYLTNFWRTNEILFINCETNLQLK